MSDITTAPRLAAIRVDEIDLIDGHNPRDTITAESIAPLADSIRAHGVLQPIRVRPDGNGRHQLIAGERRLTAARQVGLEEIPAIIASADADPGTEALIENLQRQDLNPVEEAHAYQRLMKTGKLSQKKLANLLSISPDTVSERLRLLRLPDQVQVHVAAGAIAQAAVRVLEEIAKPAPDIAVLLADKIAAGDVDSDELVRSPEYTVPDTLHEAQQTAGGPVAYGLGRHFTADDVGLDPDRDGDLLARAEALEGEAHHYGSGFRLEDEDLDAARAYGCLLELKSGTAAWGYQTALVCDRDWMVDRFAAILDREAQRVADDKRAQAKRSADAAGVNIDSDSGDGDPGEVLKQAQAAERAAQLQARDDAYVDNTALGAKAITKLAKAKITKDRMRLIALRLLSQETSVVAAGLRLCDTRLHGTEERQLKDGRTKVKHTWPSQTDTHKEVVDRVNRARNAEEIMGILLQTYVCAVHADDRATSQSDRVWWNPPGEYFYYGDPVDRTVRELVDKEARPLLPERMAARHAERDQEAQAAAADRADRGHPNADIDADADADIDVG